MVVVNVLPLPEQTEVAPAIVGVVGKAFTVSVMVLLTAEVQPVTVFLILKEYVPAVETESVLADELSLHK